ncbi:hypothetical protein ACVWVY_006756 [Bradyrhizobium sp. URHC0002]
MDRRLPGFRSEAADSVRTVAVTGPSHDDDVVGDDFLAAPLFATVEDIAIAVLSRSRVDGRPEEEEPRHVSRPLRFDHAGGCGEDLRPSPEGAGAGSGNCYVSASVRKSVALVPISLGLTESSPAVAAGLVAATATFRESATGAIIIFQGSMRTSAQKTKACIGQNAGCMYSSSFSLQCTAGQGVPCPADSRAGRWAYADIAVRGSGAEIGVDLALGFV